MCNCKWKCNYVGLGGSAKSKCNRMPKSKCKGVSSNAVVCVRVGYMPKGKCKSLSLRVIRRV